MRPSAVSHSSMPSGKAYIGWWGDMGGPAQKGIYTYMQSSYKQRAFAGALHGYLFWGYKRIAAQAPYFAIPVAAGYGTYVWAKNKAEYLASKAGHGHGDHH
ncbi:ubiquinol--cytochrome-c reductase subunit 8 [Tulasnella sp. UAMH 9824]|nr:ubiquinol--cytochrome-c reductase subunit 8 [Tulasnella sp. UAMH 9824]